MVFNLPMTPPGSGKHPIIMVVISANDLAASTAFYSKVFGWQTYPMSGELTAAVAPAGPTISLRSNIPEGFPPMVPYIGVRDVDKTLTQIISAGGSIERATWSAPMIGKLARFKDLSGTIYGLTSALPPGDVPPIPMPFGANPKPHAGSICSLEMFAKDGEATARFFGDAFGWSTVETMPQYIAFDPGAGVAGVFQSHSPTVPAVAYIYATDIAAKLTEIESAGGKRLCELIKIPGAGSFGYFRDPSGSTMGLMGE